MKDPRFIELGAQKGIAEILSEMQERADDQIKSVPDLKVTYQSDNMRFGELKPDPAMVARIYKENMNPPGTIGVCEQSINKRNQGR